MTKTAGTGIFFKSYWTNITRRQCPSRVTLFNNKALLKVTKEETIKDANAPKLIALNFTANVSLEDEFAMKTVSAYVVATNLKTQRKSFRLKKLQIIEIQDSSKMSQPSFLFENVPAKSHNAAKNTVNALAPD